MAINGCTCPSSHLAHGLSHCLLVPYDCSRPSSIVEGVSVSTASHRIASHRIALCLQSKNPPRLHMTRPTFLMTVVSSSLHPLPWASDSCISFGFPDSQVPRFIDVVQSHRLTARDFVLIILIPLRGIAVPHFLHISSLHSDLYSHFQFPFFDST